MTVAALATLFVAKSLALQQPDVPAILQDRSIFTYLKPGPVEIKPQGTYFAFDALPTAAASTNPAKLKVIVLIAERHFDTPARTNIIERRDKERLVALMPLAATYLKNYSKGEVEVTIVPKFVPEPVFGGQIANVARSEFNRNKFEADDSVDRGPYDLVTTIESSNIALYVGEPKSGAGILSANIIGAAWNRLTQDGSESVFAPTPGKVPNLTRSVVEHLQGTRSFTEADKDLFSAAATTAPVGLSYPVQIAIEGGALDYTEECLVRQERLPLPFNTGERTAKSLTFDYKPLTQNPVAIRLKTLSGWEELTLPAGTFDWKNIQVKSSKGEVIEDAQIGVPLLRQGCTRSFSELVHYQFRNFTASETAAGIPTITESAIRESNPDVAAM
ncbi:MAG TPA: hypothetical protein VK171_03545, partial [Fimbriimonas sp.]|nr:hypothetical protein [Fimbriimonas sp.]